jgi:hypothetical protein
MQPKQTVVLFFIVMCYGIKLCPDSLHTNFNIIKQINENLKKSKIKFLLCFVAYIKTSVLVECGVSRFRQII